MKLKLDVNQQKALFDAYQQMDAADTVVVIDGAPKIVRVPFRLGAARRSLVKNITALKASLAFFDQARVSLIKEIWPDLPDGTDIKKSEYPTEFAIYELELAKIARERDEIDLAPMPDDVIYEANEFPLAAIAALDEHGLIAPAAD